MSPEDVILFVTQDMNPQARPPGTDVAPVFVRPEDTVKRLRTSVMSDRFSSYAKCHDIEYSWR
jgi:hypothetical protein